MRGIIPTPDPLALFSGLGFPAVVLARWEREPLRRQHSEPLVRGVVRAGFAYCLDPLAPFSSL